MSKTSFSLLAVRYHFMYSFTVMENMTPAKVRSLATILANNVHENCRKSSSYVVWLENKRKQLKSRKYLINGQMQGTKHFRACVVGDHTTTRDKRTRATLISSTSTIVHVATACTAVCSRRPPTQCATSSTHNVLPDKAAKVLTSAYISVYMHT